MGASARESLQRHLARHLIHIERCRSASAFVKRTEGVVLFELFDMAPTSRYRQVGDADGVSTWGANNRPASRCLRLRYRYHPATHCDPAESGADKRSRSMAGISADHRQHDIGRHRWRRIDSLRGLDEILFRRLINTGNEFLRIPVNDRKPGGLDLHHYAMSLAEHVVMVAKEDVP